MRNGDFLPREDAKYVSWLKNFAAQCESYSTILGLSATEVSSIESAASSFETNFDGMVAANATARQATEDKNLSRRSTQSLVRRFAKEFKANPAISPAILQALGVVANASSSPVVPVTSLVGVGQSDGVNQLRWNRNGNSQGTTFIIEYRLGGSVDWQFAGVTTKIRFSHINQIPGQEIWYRVISSRAGVNSVPCTPEAIYGNDGDGSLSIAA